MLQTHTMVLLELIMKIGSALFWILKIHVKNRIVSNEFSSLQYLMDMEELGVLSI